jgi:methionyl-tRNA formyltransferase
MKNLVFTAKWIGLNCVKHLIQKFPQDEYLFVVGDPDADLIVDELKRHHLNWKMIGPEVIEEIRQKPAGYYDWLLNVWGSFIFKEDILSKTKQSLNIHPSFLPYCRGRDPVVWAIKHGWPAGVTLHEITPGVDEGAIWAQEQVPYSLPTTGGDLYAQVADRCWQLFEDKWADIRSLKIKPVPQVEIDDIRTFKRKDLKVDQVIDLDSDSQANLLLRRLLAHDFSSDYRAEIIINAKRYRVKLHLDPIE